MSAVQCTFSEIRHMENDDRKFLHAVSLYSNNFTTVTNLTSDQDSHI